LHVFMCDILANMTQVSDVAPGPLVWYSNKKKKIIRFIKMIVFVFAYSKNLYNLYNLYFILSFHTKI
jgi:hypothetical protein